MIDLINSIKYCIILILNFCVQLTEELNEYKTIAEKACEVLKIGGLFSFFCCKCWHFSGGWDNLETSFPLQENVSLKKDLESKEDDKKGEVVTDSEGAMHCCG